VAYKEISHGNPQRSRIGSQHRPGSDARQSLLRRHPSASLCVARQSGRGHEPERVRGGVPQCFVRASGSNCSLATRVIFGDPSYGLNCRRWMACAGARAVEVSGRWDSPPSNAQSLANNAVIQIRPGRPIAMADQAKPLSPAKEVGELANREIGINRNCPSQLILWRFRLSPFPPVHPSFFGDSPTPFAEERGLAFAALKVGQGSQEAGLQGLVARHRN